MASKAPIPVTILAGSFGAGKTTACNELLTLLAPSKAKVAVIAHRFAEEYLCQPLVVDPSQCELLEEVYDYGSGCLCCTPGGELNQRLNSMTMWGEQYDHVIIRTGPAADPMIFADAVQRSSAYGIAGIVTVVDADVPCFADQLTGAALDQLLAADVLLVRGEEVPSAALQQALEQKDVTAPAFWWNGPLRTEQLQPLLNCRRAQREYACKPSQLIPNLVGAVHDTALRSVQIVENGTVDLEAFERWVLALMRQGYCIRLKAVLPVDTESGRQALLVNAVRGQPVELRLVPEAPSQVYMGDLQTLINGMKALDYGQPIARMFIALAPPSVKGLGDMADLFDAMPSNDDLIDGFTEDVLATQPSKL
mmetsp:Transcript_22339/g.51789  ORF Transcript_22339/g.51789 Transcript_22339/m.51789 type:complete len:365 (-) Transcript_22339:106-1200(-)